MATIVVSAQEVITAAENVIAGILAKREAKNEEMILNTINHSFPGKLRKFFGVKPLTREEAIKKLRADFYGSWYPSIYAWGDLEKAKNLLRLAKHGDPVTLNEEDCRVLF